MKEINLEERKKLSLDILKEFDSICKEHSINYYLAYGSLLGCVRHKGFIPWDDDVDVWIPIEQYVKLLNILNKESKYKLINHISDKNWIFNFSKLSNDNTIIVDNVKDSLNTIISERGVSIDLFPLYRIPSGKKKKLFCRKIIFIQSIMIKLFCYNNHTINTTFLKRVFMNFINLIGGMNFLKAKLLKLEQKYKKSIYIGCPTSPYGFKDIHFTCDFEPSELEFEGMYFSVPKGYDHILRDIYGNYMEFPPLSRRNSGHDVKVFYK